MLKDEALINIQTVSYELGIPTPKLVWEGIHAVARASLPKRIIFINPLTPNWTILHEMAHILSFHRKGERALVEIYGGHGYIFFQALRSVAKTWYGDERKYPWHLDYQHIRNWAFDLNLTYRLR